MTDYSRALCACQPVLSEIQENSLLEKAIALHPNNSEYINKKSYILQQMGRHEEAFVEIEKVININPLNGDAWSSKSQILEKMNRLGESLEAINTAIKINEENYFYLQKGDILKKLKRYDEAYQAYIESIKNNKLCSYELLQIASIYALNKDNINMLDYLSKAISMGAYMSPNEIRDEALKDDSFSAFWDDGDFNKLVSQTQIGVTDEIQKPLDQRLNQLDQKAKNLPRLP